MHLDTTLQQICDFIMHLLLKRFPAFECNSIENILKEMKSFRLFMEIQYRNDVSSLAAKNQNKPSMLSLIKDILDFRNHILKNW